MRGEERARRSRRIRIRRRVGILLIAGIALTAFLYYRPVQAYMRTSTSLAERKAEVRRLKHDRRDLQRRLALDESGATLVREARRLGLVRPDEELYIVKGIEAWRRARHVAHSD